MTFSVVTVTDNQEKVVGTIWADAEAQAQMIASDLWRDEQQQRNVTVRRAEEREIPLRLAH